MAQNIKQKYTIHSQMQYEIAQLTRCRYHIPIKNNTLLSCTKLSTLN